MSAYFRRQLIFFVAVKQAATCACCADPIAFRQASDEPSYSSPVFHYTTKYRILKAVCESSQTAFFIPALASVFRRWPVTAPYRGGQTTRLTVVMIWGKRHFRTQNPIRRHTGWPIKI